MANKEQYQERDWILEIEERSRITSAEMQFFVNRMGTSLVFNAPDLAGVLMCSTNNIYALVDAGQIGYIDRGSAKKRYCIFPRESVFKFLQDRCNRA
jgi:hypothetical protein